MSFWVAGAALGGALISNKGAKDAAKTTSAAADRSSEIVRQNYLDSAKRLDPYSEGVAGAMDLQRTIAGVNGTEKQQEFYDNFQFSPYADFQRKEAMKVIGQNAMATGTLKSGSRLKSISDYINGLTSQEVNNRFNQAGAIVGTGLAADSAIAGVSQNAAVTQADIINNAGIQSANAKLGRSAAFQSGLADLAAIGQDYFSSRPKSASSYGWQGSVPINAGGAA